MNELIKYTAEILNIKTNSKLVVFDMQSELQGITDIADYQKFIRSNINYLGMEYMTGFQKFIKLTEMYKRQYTEKTNQGRIGKGIDTAQKLANKIKEVSSHVEDNNDLTFINFSTDGKCYFTDFEIKQLKKIGSLNKCVRLQKSISGEDALLERLKGQMREIVLTKALVRPQEKTDRNVAKLMSSMAEKVRA